MQIRGNRWFIGLLLLLFLHHPGAFGQQEQKVVSLGEAIRLAQEQSLDAMVAKSQLRAAYWQYRNYKADLLPNVKLMGTLPSFNRTLSSYLKEDGTYKYVSSNSISEQLSLSVTQNIPLTGGQLSLQSQLERVDQLDGERATEYMSVPFNVVLSQPLITANPLKWSMKIEPEKYKEAQQQFAVSMENVAIQAISYYFDLLLAMINVNIDKQNLASSEKLMQIAQGKRERGLISDNDLLQLKLNYLNASSSLIQTEQAYDQKMFALRNYLGYNDQVVIVPDIPGECPEIEVTFKHVMELASRNNPFRYDVVCRMLQAQQQVAQAKANRGFQADVYASIGYTGSDRDFKHTYRNLRNRESVSLGISIPILNWGKGRGQVELARSQEEITRVQMEKETLNFEQEVLTAVKQYQEQNRLNEIVRLADTVAQKRYKTAYETFVLGQISVLDLNTAQTEQDNARRTYISQLYSSWVYFYTLRKLTLYDFEKKEDIIYEQEKY
ncbi:MULTISPECIES: TolC family protein [Butyricimonas]|uniref:TolC family protein n=1 Tax=Butyricimonas TaxID=574697 RepID=UPI0007FB4921|nr:MULTISPECIES: TolC family protein [Butyricimonas]